MHSWLNITIALTIPESASWRVVGNPGNYGQGLVNAEIGKVDFKFRIMHLHVQVACRWLILLGLLRIVDTNEANLEGCVECQRTESK